MTQSIAKQVITHKLSNGLTLLIRPSHQIPKVSLQMWYNVGSKDEGSGERGLAHLLEHMIFKGTQKLSESDINEIVHKLSGYCNAFTSCDYTGYMFDLPTQNWTYALPIMADCMRNCTFKADLLTSEMKAVIQELKMYKDNYTNSLIESLVSAIFPDHPYHHPIIGYKQDLWNMQRDALMNFYKKHYVPNNATLVIVGDVEPHEVIAQVEKNFAYIPADPTYKKEEFYHNKDLVAQSIVMYRDVQQPTLIMAFVVPGTKEKNEDMLDALSWLLASGKGSRLYSKLVDELQLATDIDASVYDLFDYALMIIAVEPKDATVIDDIIKVIHAELNDYITNGIPHDEFVRSVKKTQVDFISVLESNQKQAYLMGKFFLATGDAQVLFNYLQYAEDILKKEMHELLQTYFRPTLAHVGRVLPLPEQEKEYWDELQEISDEQDARILSKKVRATSVEAPLMARMIHPNPPVAFTYPHATNATLANGLQMLYYNNALVPKIELILDFKAKSYYDPADREGLTTFMCALLLEGTTTYNGTELAKALESLGMSISVTPGYIHMSMLAQDLEKGLAFLQDILLHATFTPEAIEKVRQVLIADLKQYWDEPMEFVGDLVRRAIYKTHPYSKNLRGTLASIAAITREDILACYQSYITPQGTRCAVAGDLKGYDVQQVFERWLGFWQGPKVPDLAYPIMVASQTSEFVYPINRDQVVVCFAGISIPRSDPDYDKLLLFDQIFTGGVTGTMSSRLFQLREQTGLFYTIGGSLITNADEQPGMVFVKTIVSLDRLAEAEHAIKRVIDDTIDTITQEELDQARNAIINAMVDHFETNYSISATFLALARYKLPATYFDTRAQTLQSITLDEVKKAAHRVLNTKQLALFKVGRVQTAQPML